MLHTWKRLLFLHWRVDPGCVQARLPAGLTVETYDGSAWMGIVPFEMRRIRPRWAPAFPHLSNFLELNLRTYVTNEWGTPGVWFFSLNANRRLAVALGRKCFSLPYHRCQMRCVTDRDGWIDYACRRLSDPEGRDCRFRYRPAGEPAPTEVGTLEFFLVERYILFAQRRDGALATGQVHHVPYPVQPVELEQWDAQQFAIDGFATGDSESLRRPMPDRLAVRPPDHALFSPGVDVEVFRLKRPVEAAAPGPAPRSRVGSPPAP